MSKRYPGGVISKTAPVVVGPTGSPPEGGSAPGIWTLEQAAGYIKQGLWPKPILPRELYSWGSNIVGQLGQNNLINRSSPVQVGALANWSQISAGEYHCAAITTSGTLFTWGFNNQGQLGLNTSGAITDRSSPVQVGALTTWSQVSSGDRFCASITTSGTLFTWGANNVGQIGDNSVVYRSSPVQVGALTTWSQISAGNLFCAAITTSGTLFTWGSNNYGNLGLNDIVKRSSPVQVGSLTTWSQVDAGTYFCAAIKTDGTLWTWGSNNSGQLGQNNSYLISRSSPVQVGALTTWSQVNAGFYFCAAIKTDGTLWTWGRNNFGQLGKNDVNINRSSPVQVGALTNWSKISVGYNFCAAIKTDGSLWTWGSNSSGKLGQNNTINLSSPVQVGALTTWSKVSAGRDFSVGILN